MEIKQLLVTSINLVQLSESPFLRLLNKGKINAVAQAFQFEHDASIHQEAGGAPRLRLQNGLHTFEDGRELTIPRLDVQPRKIVLELTGSSEDARLVYVALADVLEDIIAAPKEKLLSPILHTEETIVTSHLAFPAEALFVKELLAATMATASEASTDEFTAHARPGRITFEVDYLPTDLTFSESRIGLTRKEISIGPKIGFPLEEQVYQSNAPLDTNAHIAFLEMLERNLVEGSK